MAEIYKKEIIFFVYYLLTETIAQVECIELTNNSLQFFICKTFLFMEDNNFNYPANENGLKWIEIFFHSNAYFK